MSSHKQTYVLLQLSALVPKRSSTSSSTRKRQRDPSLLKKKREQKTKKKRTTRKPAAASRRKNESSSVVTHGKTASRKNYGRSVSKVNSDGETVTYYPSLRKKRSVDDAHVSTATPSGAEVVKVSTATPTAADAASACVTPAQPLKKRTKISARKSSSGKKKAKRTKKKT